MKLFLLSALVLASKVFAIDETAYRSKTPEAFQQLLSDIESDRSNAKTKINTYRNVIRSKFRGSVETTFGRDYLSKTTDAAWELMTKAAEFGPVELLRLLHTEFKLPYHYVGKVQPLSFAFKRFAESDKEAADVVLEIVSDRKTVDDLKPIEDWKDDIKCVKLLGHAASQLVASYEGREVMLKVFEMLKPQLSEPINYILLDYFMAQYATGGKTSKYYYELLNEMLKKKMILERYTSSIVVAPKWQDRSGPNLAEINSVNDEAETIYKKHGPPLMMATIFELPFWFLKDLAKATSDINHKHKDDVFDRYLQQFLASSFNQHNLAETLRVPLFADYLKEEKPLMARVMKVVKDLKPEAVYPMTFYKVLAEAYNVEPSRGRFLEIVQKILDFAPDHSPPNDFDAVFRRAISAYFKDELESALRGAEERLAKDSSDATPFVENNGDAAKVLAAAYLVSAKSAGGSHILDPEIDKHAWGHFGVSISVTKSGPVEELKIDDAMQRLAEEDGRIRYWLEQRSHSKKRPKHHR